MDAKFVRTNYTRPSGAVNAGPVLEGRLRLGTA